MRSFLVILFVVCCLSAYSAPSIETLMFGNFCSKDGVSNDYVDDILVDDNGFLWLATWDGLNKFDGKHWVVYKHREGDSLSLPSNQIVCLFQDSKRRIWVGTILGISYYMPSLDGFFTPKFVMDGVPNDSRISSIVSDPKNGDVLFATGEWPCRYSQSTKSFGTLSGFDGDSINYIPLITIYFASPTIMYGGTIMNGFWKYDFSSRSTSRIVGERNRVFDINRSSVYGITKVGNSHLWVSTTVGLVVYDMVSDQVLEEMLPGVFIKSVCVIDDDLFVNCINHPVMLGSVAQNKGLRHVQYFNTGNLNISYNTTSVVRIDKAGNIWIGTHGQGVVYMDKAKQNFITYTRNTPLRLPLVSNIVSCFVEQPDGRVWVGTDGGGIQLFDRKENAFKTYDVLACKAVVGIKQWDNGRLWVATYGGGLNLFDPASNSVIAYTNDPSNPLSIPSNDLKYVAVLNDTTVAVAMSGTGAAFLNPSTGSFRSMHNDSSLMSIFKDNRWVNHIMTDTRGRVWYSSSNGILMDDGNKFNYYLSDKKNDNTLSNNSVRLTFQDSRGTIWAGTFEGVDTFDNAKNHFVRLAGSLRLPGNVKSMQEDNMGNIWVSSNSGIVRVEKDLLSTKLFDARDGLQGNQFFQASSCTTSDGFLFFGGLNGFNIINPSNYEIVLPDMSIALTDFQLFNKSQVPGDASSVIAKHINYTDTVFLLYKQSVFSIEFVKLDVLGSDKLRYKYILENFDNQWYATSENKVTYTNLDPGTYVFKIKATNRKGEWVNNSVKRLTIVVITPWWMTWWFRILVLALLGSWVTYELVRYKRRNVTLQRLVEVRTRELNDSNEELRHQYNITRQQSEELVLKSNELLAKNSEIEAQNEQIEMQNTFLSATNNKLENTIRTKDKFMSIIGHDLKNPIGAILAITDLAVQNYYKQNDEKRLSILNAVNTSSKHVYDLLQNILLWAKSQMGSVQVDPVSFKITDVVESVVGLLFESACKKNISIQMFVEPTHVVFADRNMIFTVVRNLVSNCIKFTPDGGSISIKTTEIEAGLVNIRVDDTGVGMTQQQIDDLFLLAKSNSTRGTNDEVGTGLGLLICSDFLRYHNAEISVTSQVGVGSSFAFNLAIGKKSSQ